MENSVIESTDVHGVNFNGNASNCTVKNNFIRGTGDDSLAIWSYPTADSNITFANNTIVAPTLANGIADYGGDNNTISNNVVADDNALGSGIDISNEEFLSPFTPLTGTINVTGNYLIRAGAYNPNWDHPMGAVQFDSYDSAFSGVTVNYSGGAILDSPYEAFEFVSGSGDGYSASGINISNVNVANVGTVVMQAETTGSASVSGVTASGVGVGGAYNYAYPSNTAGAYTFNLGSGDSGWSTTPVLTAYPEPVQAGTLTSSASSLSFGDVNSGSTSAAQTVTVTNPGTSAVSVSSVSVTGNFTQTNTCGSSIAAGGSCTVSVKFAPASGGPLTGTLSVATSAPGSPLTVALSGTGVTATTNLALGQPATASSDYETYVPANVTDGNTSTYWESTDGAGYPQTLTVQLPSDESIGSLQLYLPPPSAWSTRTETLSVLGSANGTSFSQIVGSAGYTFNPSTGNEVTISLPSGTTAEYVSSASPATPAGAPPSSPSSRSSPAAAAPGRPAPPLTASPTSLSFGNEATGSTSASQSVTVSNPGSSAVSMSSIGVTGPFSESNNCGTSLAAGASCTVGVEFAPTATGAATGTLSVSSSAPEQPADGGADRHRGHRRKRADGVADQRVVRQRADRVDQRGADRDGHQPGRQRGHRRLGQRRGAVRRDQQHLRQLDRRGRVVHGQRHLLADCGGRVDRDALGGKQRSGQPAVRRAVRHRGQHDDRPGPQPADHRQRLHAELRARQRGGREHQHLLGEHGQRLPPVVPGGSRLVADRRQHRDGPAAVDRLGNPHPDADHPGQHQRLHLHHPGGVGQLHLQPIHR